MGGGVRYYLASGTPSVVRARRLCITPHFHHIITIIALNKQRLHLQMELCMNSFLQKCRFRNTVAWSPWVVEKPPGESRPNLPSPLGEWDM